MKEVIKANARNPHVLRKLIRFKGFVPANIIEKEKKAIIPVEISQEEQAKLFNAKDNNATVEINYEGKKYKTNVARVYMVDKSKDIDEIELVAIG